MSSVLTRTDHASVATLTMERPAARNALSMELMTALLGAFDAISKDTSIKAVILRGSGPAFCAGHDLKEMRANPGRAFMQETFETCARLMLAITRLRQPVTAEVHGIATAAGCQLVATCDLAVCADDARFATPGVNIGLFCSTPMVALTRAVGRKAAMKMLLTGDMIDAAEAIRIGLVNAAVAPSKLREAAEALAAQIASKSGPVLAIGKEAFSRQIEMSLEDAYTYAGQVMTENMMLRDAAEGIDAFLEKRKPTWCD
jgi:enoyl-CoA hydratase/carnithine racemase